MPADYARLARISLDGFKSIGSMRLDLGSISVLIGSNGSGKSNFVSLFAMLERMKRAGLQLFVATSGGANSLLHYSAKHTREIHVTLEFDKPTHCEYEFLLEHAPEDTLVFAHEELRSREARMLDGSNKWDLGRGHRESRLTSPQEGHFGDAVAGLFLLDSCQPFQFHDTSSTAAVRQSVYVHDNRSLRHDAGNLAAVLYRLKHSEPAYYERILETVRQVAPFFGDFILEPLPLNTNNVLLNWREADSDVVFGPHQLSDGSLRVMALITLLLQPTEKLPSTIIIDEPELGLHPFAITVLASLIKQVAHHCQVILATQSVALLDQFEPEDVVVVEREGRESTFKRLDAEELKDWLEQYSLGELWEKNVLGGGPV